MRQTDRRFGDLLAGAGRSSVASAAFLSRFVFRGQVPIVCAPARYTGRAPNSSSSCCCSHVRRGDAKVADYGANVDMMLCLNQSMAAQQSSVATQSSRMNDAATSTGLNVVQLSATAERHSESSGAIDDNMKMMWDRHQKIERRLELRHLTVEETEAPSPTAASTAASATPGTSPRTAAGAISKPNIFIRAPESIATGVGVSAPGGFRQMPPWAFRDRRGGPTQSGPNHFPRRNVSSTAMAQPRRRARRRRIQPCDRPMVPRACRRAEPRGRGQQFAESPPPSSSRGTGGFGHPEGRRQSYWASGGLLPSASQGHARQVYVAPHFVVVFCFVL